MKPLKIALCLAILVALSNSGYSEELKPNTLSNPSENRDEDSPSSLNVQSAPWLTMAEKFFRGTLGERTSHVVTRSDNPCVKRETVVVYNGLRLYKEVECEKYSITCTGPKNNCGPSAFSYIAALNGKKVVADCGCKA